MRPSCVQHPSSFVGYVAENGADFAIADAGKELATARTELCAALSSAGYPSTHRIVLHFDEMQHFEPPVEWARNKDAPVAKADFVHYRMIGLTSILDDLIGGGVFLPALSGTARTASKLRTDSALKREYYVLPPFPPTAVYTVLMNALKPSAVLTERCSSRWMQMLSGTPRVLQSFLKKLFGALTTCVAADVEDNVNAVLLAALDRAQDWFNGYILGGLSSASSAVPLSEFLVEVYIAFLFPSILKGRYDSVAGVDVLVLQAASVPLHWKTMATSGLPRLREEGDGVLVFPPYPFLVNFIHCKLHLLGVQDVVKLASPYSFAELCNGNAGKGYALQIGIALELGFSDSGLWRLLRKHLADVAPVAAELGRLQCTTDFSDHVRRNVVLERHTFSVCASDNPAVHNRWIDIAVPATIGGKPGMIVAEVKNVADVGLVRAAAAKVLPIAAGALPAWADTPGPAVFVLFSYHAVDVLSASADSTRAQAATIQGVLTANPDRIALVGGIADLEAASLWLPLHELATAGTGTHAVGDGTTRTFAEALGLHSLLVRVRK